ncbi:hypothetical protein DH2020_004928 [Rehmannia glutinosa]|uniref:Uncharacterized protein n=1 Tax=Rehmannia glutinosa TaxID=99300 RepID=A0ABR0XQS1_REHGL
MSCFLLPQNVCQQINSIVSNFWWGQKHEERRIYWCSWNNLTKAKHEGGLGFRDLQCFNEAMLAKQRWRLIHESSSLLAQSLHARYYPNNNFLNATIGYNPSYTWKIIVAGRQIITKGIQWNIGNGCDTLVWKDPWVPNLPKFRILSPQGEGIMELRDGDLMHEDMLGWNVEQLKELFNPLEVTTIRSIPLISMIKRDRIMRHYTKNGIYSVKYGYLVAKKDQDNERASTSSTGNDYKLWRWTW